jgi:very-short-patch-repair endonuclease
MPPYLRPPSSGAGTFPPFDFVSGGTAVVGLVPDGLTRYVLGMAKVDPELRGLSRANRRQMNHAETRLWWHIRRRQFGVQFRRQHVAFGRIMDFACLSLKLNVEVDGSQHDRNLDRLRDEFLEARGWTVLRFWSWEIYRNNETVLDTIGSKIDELRLK